MERDDAQLLKEAADDESNLFSGYGQYVMLLDAHEPPIMEALIDCSPEQLLKVIDVCEDRLNDDFMPEDDAEQSIRQDREQFKHYLFIREYAKILLRQRLGVETVAQGFNFDLARDNILEENEDVVELPDELKPDGDDHRKDGGAMFGGSR